MSASIWLPRHAPHSLAAVGRVAGARPLLLLGAQRHLHVHRRPAYPPVPRTLVSHRLVSTGATPTPAPSPPPPPPKEVVEHKEPLGTRVWKKVKHEAQHYWHGSKLLVSEVRIASRLQLKILRGGSLTRRERRQVRALLPRLARCSP
jgi:LETM1 and EF-hand domain-containing protein 1